MVSILKNKGTFTGQEERMRQIIAMIEAWPPFSLSVASFTEKPDDLSQWRAYALQDWERASDSQRNALARGG